MLRKWGFAYHVLPIISRFRTEGNHIIVYVYVYVYVLCLSLFGLTFLFSVTIPTPLVTTTLPYLTLPYLKLELKLLLPPITTSFVSRLIDISQALSRLFVSSIYSQIGVRKCQIHDLGTRLAYHKYV